MVKYVVKDFLSFSLNYENLKFLGQNTAKMRGLKPKKRSSPDTRLRVEAPGLVKTSGLEPPTPCMSRHLQRHFMLKTVFFAPFRSESHALRTSYIH